MVNGNIFTIEKEDFLTLNPDEAIEFFHRLLWAEASRSGIELSKINISSEINVPDGGTDASVKDSKIKDDLIKFGQTSYQIKASVTFKPTQKRVIQKELFGNKPVDKNNLGSRVKNCLDNNGTYVLICFKQDFNELQKIKVINNIQHYFSECGYINSKVDLLSINNLKSFISFYPSLVLYLKRKSDLIFQTHKSWSNEAEMQRKLEIGDIQKELIENLRNELRTNIEAIHIHITGEAGIGKTRLILEATKINDLEPFIIYCDKPSKFLDSNLFNEILREDNKYRSILIIDECDQDNRTIIWNKLKNLSSRIKLVTISNESEKDIGNTKWLNVKQSDSDIISKIIRNYGIPKDQANRYTPLCSGSPRVAHVIGENLKNNPEDLLKTPSTINIWGKYIVGGDDKNSQVVHQRLVVLRYIALFERFGYGKTLSSEAKAISKLINKGYPEITWVKFQEIINELIERNILQGEYTLYITPKAFHIYLWIDWWKYYGVGFNLEEFKKLIDQLPVSLRNWFYEMFKYATESEAASHILKKLFSRNGPFGNDEFIKTMEGANFFLVLTEATPKLALEYLKNTIDNWTIEELLEFKTGRREIIWALEKIAIWKELFLDAARLLLKLAEAENETWSNNATGVFIGLFTLAPKPVAPTEASPQERFIILKESIQCKSKKRRLIALRACGEALEPISNTFRLVGAEYQGLRKEPNLWMPKTWGEIFSSYRRVWQFLDDALDKLEEDERQEAINIIIERSRYLMQIESLANMVMDTLEKISKNFDVAKKKLVREVIDILHYDSKEISANSRKRLEQFKSNLIGSDFSSLMKRYVGMQLMEDRFDEEGNIVDQVTPKIEELAQEIIENNELIIFELEWLTTEKAENGYAFGYEIGKKDKGFSLLPIFISAQRKTKENESVFFLGGYFRALFERNTRKWEEQLDVLVKDHELNKWIPKITWRSGFTDKAALRILNLAEKGIIEYNDFQIFSSGGIIQKISKTIFNKWINFLLSVNKKKSVLIALDLYYFYYIINKTDIILPKILTYKLLLHNCLSKNEEVQFRNITHEWSGICQKYLELFPEKSIGFAKIIFKYLREKGTIFADFHSPVLSVLENIVIEFPSKSWEIVSKYLESSKYTKIIYLREWLRGGFFLKKEEKGAISLFPTEIIWNWIDGDVSNRAKQITRLVPNKLFRKKGELCLARELLMYYGDRKDVRRALIANFYSEGWSGKGSLHYQNRKQEVINYKKEEENTNVKNWIDEYVAALDESIEREKLEEEREGFS
jgi:hypothetical protein